MQSLSLINGMYKDINEIVDKQGQTLTRIEDNTVDTKDNIVEAKNEIKKALKNEKTIM